MGNQCSCLSGPEDDNGLQVTVTKAQPQDGKGAATSAVNDEGKKAGVEFDSTQIKSELIGNILDPVDGPAAGLPYQVHYLGPPLPPCEQGRSDTMQALSCINKQPTMEDPEIVSILKLTKSMFKAPVALVALFDQKQVYVAEEDGGVIPRGSFPWRWTLCAWSLAYANPTILVIPDTHLDYRFRENEKVTCFPNVRFYCGAPLVASNGHRLGTLCFADIEPRPKFDAASCSVMNNLSELVVRHLEKDLALKLKEKDNLALQQTYGHLQRTLDCFTHCVVLLDTSTPGWRVLYANASFSKMTGMDRNQVLGKSLSTLFDGFQGMELPNLELEKAAAQCLEFQVSSATLKAQEGVTGTYKASRPFALTFRPAVREGLDESVVSIGIPSFLPANTTISGGAALAASSSYYFMTVDVLRTGSLQGRRSTTGSLLTFGSNTNEVVEGLELGHLLGRGSFGAVYYGTWVGTPVAVKVIDHDDKTSAGVDGAALEAVLGKELRHPNIVQTLKYVHKRIHRSHGNTLSVHMSGQHTGTFGSSNTTNAWKDSGRFEGVLEEAGEEEEEDNKDAHAWPVFNMDHAALMEVEEEGEEEEADKDNNNILPGGEAVSYSHAIVPAARASMDQPSGGNSQKRNAKLNDFMGSRQSNKVSPHSSSSHAGTMGQTWLLLEFCDKGCLQEAIDRGWLRTERSALTGGPNMTAVVATSLEVARALAYLHSCQVVHGDLSSWNVMLCSSGLQAEVGNRAFTAKVGDFGLSRTLEIQSRIQTKNYGTLTHMPPETLTQGTVSTAVDVYSLGVLLWQMYTSSRPWCGLTHSQIIMLVAQQGAKLQFPAETPTAFKALALACMESEPDARPAMEDVVKILQAMLEALQEHGSLGPVDHGAIDLNM